MDQDESGLAFDEYEGRETPTARFAYAIDRLQPLLLNSASGGVAWRQNGIRHGQATAVNAPIVGGATELWDLARMILAEAADAAQLVDDRSGAAT